MYEIRTFWEHDNTLRVSTGEGRGTVPEGGGGRAQEDLTGERGAAGASFHRPQTRDEGKQVWRRIVTDEILRMETKEIDAREDPEGG